MDEAYAREVYPNYWAFLPVEGFTRDGETLMDFVARAVELVREDPDPEDVLEPFVGIFDGRNTSSDNFDWHTVHMAIVMGKPERNMVILYCVDDDEVVGMPRDVNFNEIKWLYRHDSLAEQLNA